MHVHVTQHARRDANASSNHGCCDKDRFLSGFFIQPEEEEARGERQKDTGEGDSQAQASQTDQIAGHSFQTNREKQEHGTNFSNGVDCVARNDESGHVRAEYHAGYDFAENRRQVHSLKQLTKHLRPHEDGKHL